MRPQVGVDWRVGRALTRFRRPLDVDGLCRRQVAEWNAEGRRDRLAEGWRERRVRAALALKSWTLREEGPAIAWPDRDGVRTITVTLVSLACYIAVMDPLGLPLSTFLYLTFTTWYLNRSRWLLALVIGLITGGISYILFIRLLGLSFPAGFLFE